MLAPCPRGVRSCCHTHPGHLPTPRPPRHREMGRGPACLATGAVTGAACSSAKGEPSGPRRDLVTATLSRDCWPGPTHCQLATLSLPLGRRDECPEPPCCAVLPAQCSAALSPWGGSSVFTPAALATRSAACCATGPSLAPAPGSGPEHVRSAFLCKEVKDLTYRGGPKCGRSWSQALRWASVLKREPQPYDFWS